MSHWAIVIGISQYTHMSSLRYANRDAAAVRDFWTKDAKFEQVYYFAEDSPDTVLDGGVTISTQPNLSNLRQFLEVRFATPFLRPEDTLWFFFSGHGLHYANQDYLIPVDGIPEAADVSAVSVDSVVDCLRYSGTNNIVLMLDACHTEDQRFGQGFGTDPEGVIALFAANFDQVSNELNEVERGSFTHVLLEGSKILGEYKTTTLEHLYLYLSDRLPKVNHHFRKPTQTPRIHVDPSLALDRIFIPQVIHKRSLFRLPLLIKREIERGANRIMRPSETPLIPSTKSLFSPPLALGSAIFAIACTGLASYAIYSTLLQNPTAASKNSAAAKNNSAPGSIDPLKSPPQNSTAVIPASETSASPAKRGQKKPNIAASPPDSSSFYIEPRTGKYYSTDPLFSTSRREIDRDGSRICIKMINGSKNSVAVEQSQVIVSSLSRRKDVFYVDATGEKLRLDPDSADITDNSSLWQRLETKASTSPLMTNCLEAKQPYINRTKGEL